MGEHNVVQIEDAVRRRFVHHILDDLRALERMIQDGLIETGIRRIGAEQELFLIDEHANPSLDALEVLENTDDKHFTTELGRFNLEINLDPMEFTGDSLGKLQADLDRLLTIARAAAEKAGVEVVLTGILPTLRKGDLNLDSMTPVSRYKALNDAMCAQRGDAYSLMIKGIDELRVTHETVMLEACNTSFQLHFQCAPDEFINLYNICQLATAPVLAAATNSPLLFGRRLWRETRIALFQQAVDTRASRDSLRQWSPRVTFGKDWAQGSVLELFREDIARFRALVVTEIGEDSTSVLDRGEIPKLRALCTQNSTVYRWNRPCYGVGGGKPHLRIENRALPSGPTTRDEVANAAFWYGLISALSERHENIAEEMQFSDVKQNFLAAARLGLDVKLHWLAGEVLPADRLICDRLLPLAREGLARKKIDDKEADHYLGIVDHRVREGMTGADWMMKAFSVLKKNSRGTDPLNELTRKIAKHQWSGVPVAEWPRPEDADGPEAKTEGEQKHKILRVEQFMTTELITVAENEPLDLALNMMEWKRIRHLPVEDDKSKLVGLVSYWSLFKLMARGELEKARDKLTVRDIMKKSPVTIAPQATTLEAVETMRRHKVACLPVVKDGELVGILSERDLMELAAELLQAHFRHEGV